MAELGDLQGRTVLVTGAAGFLGCAVRAALIKAGARVIGVDRNAPRDGAYHEWRQQVCGEALVTYSPFEADVLIHLAWDNLPNRGDRDLTGDIERNVRSSIAVFEQAVASGVRTLIYPSSGGTIYGEAAVPTPESAPVQPLGGYAAGKASVELFLRALHHAQGVDACVLRLANPYGPGQRAERGQGFIATAAKRALRGEPVQLFGDGHAVRDFVYVEDAARAFVLAAARTKGFRIYNVGGGRAVSIGQALELVFDAAGRPTEVELQPARRTDLAQSWLDIGKAAEELGWTPSTSLEAGILAAVAWQRRQLPPPLRRSRRPAGWTPGRPAAAPARPATLN